MKDIFYIIIACVVFMSPIIGAAIVALLIGLKEHHGGRSNA